MLKGFNNAGEAKQNKPRGYWAAEVLQYLPILNTPTVSSIKQDRYSATANRRIKHEHTTTAFWIHDLLDKQCSHSIRRSHCSFNLRYRKQNNAPKARFNDSLVHVFAR